MNKAYAWLIVALLHIACFIAPTAAQELLFESDSVLSIKISGHLQPVLTDTSIYPIYYVNCLFFFLAVIH